MIPYRVRGEGLAEIVMCAGERTAPRGAASLRDLAPGLTLRPNEDTISLNI